MDNQKPTNSARRGLNTVYNANARSPNRLLLSDILPDRHTIE